MCGGGPVRAGTSASSMANVPPVCAPDKSVVYVSPHEEHRVPAVRGNVHRLNGLLHHLALLEPSGSLATTTLTPLHATDNLSISP